MAGLSLDIALDDAWYTGAASTSLVPLNFPVAIAGHPYMTDVRRYSRRIIPSQNQQIQSSHEPGEASLSTEGYWRRSASRFGLGAGQSYFDDDDTGSRRRFLSSKGIDIFTDRTFTPAKESDRQFGLLHDTEHKLTSSNTNLSCLTVGGYLYVADGSNLKLTADPTPSSPTFTTIAAGGAIASICTDGVYVYIAHSGAALQRTLIGANTMAAFGTLQPTLVAYANGRLIGALANAIFEIDATGAKAGGVDIRSDPRGTSATWVAITSSPRAIFAALNVGGNSEIYGIGADDQSATLDPPIWSCGLPDGETTSTLDFYAGFVIIGTSIGIRIATIQATFSTTIIGKTLEYGEAIRITGGVSCLEPQGNFCWFGWANYDGTSTGLGRMNLATNTSQDTIVPAYASDLMATAQGAVQGVCTFGANRYFVVSGSGLWGETATYVASGTLNTGWIRFSTLIPKLFTGVQLGTDALVGSVAVSANFIDGTSKAIGVANTAGATSTPLYDASGQSVACQLVFTLTRGSTSTAPVVRWWTLNALPIPPRVTEIVLVIVLASKITDMTGKERTMDPLGEFQFLDSLVSSNAQVVVQQGMASDVCRVDNVAILEKDADHWQEPRGRGGENRTHYWLDETRVSVRLLTKET